MQGVRNEIHSLFRGIELCQSLVKLGQDVDVAILKCSFPDRASIRGRHLCRATAAEFANKMNARKLFLTHIYPECDGREAEMLHEIRRTYRGESTIAADGMRVVI